MSSSSGNPEYNPDTKHHADKLIGLMMSSSRVMVCAMVFALACLALPAMPPASANDGGILYVPSAATVASHCPSSCGDFNISYPFGIGAGLLPTRLPVRAYLQPHHSTSKVVSG